MSGGQTAVARATAAVFVDGRRAGSAVLVTARHLVTAAHVLGHMDPTTGMRVSADQVEVEFPSGAGEGGRLTASRFAVSSAGAGVDVAVLDLGEDRPDWLPEPVPVWPTAQPPSRVRVFGYPLEERRLNGVWRQFAVAGPTAAGLLQLDWIGDTGTFPGHSGGPVIDSDQGALAGILVEGAERGRFDRYLPVTLIARVWRQLPRPWLLTGADRGDARSHFTRRSRGQRSAARGVDLFRGRRAALDRISAWLTAAEPPSLPLVVTGQPGAGKSAVLARAVLHAEAHPGGPGLAFHARGATIGDFLKSLSGLVDVDTAATVGDLVASLAALPDQDPLPVAVDALDEAASDLDRRQIAEALAELAVLPGLRVAVATRPLTAGNQYAPGGLLQTLGVTTCDAPNLVDLDSDMFFEFDGLCQFAALLLAQDGVDRPGPPGTAWARYRDLPAVRDQLAVVIAERAGRNFLVAAMAALPLSTMRDIVDPAASEFDPAGIPSGVGEALGKYLDQLPEQRRERDRGLLIALAYSRGTGLDDLAWLAFAAALGYPTTAADLDVLRRSPAADYLLQTTADERETRLVTRLFHQALADELLTARHQSSDERALLTVLRPEPGTTWAFASSYALTYAAEHAYRARQMLTLLDDSSYLAHADLSRLPALISQDADTADEPIAILLRQVAARANPLPPARRGRLLALAAAHLGMPELCQRLTAECDQPFRPVWAHRLGHSHTELSHDHSGVAAVAIGRVSGREVIVTGGRDGKVRVWDAITGQSGGEPLTDLGRPVSAVAIGAVSGREVIVTGGEDGKVRLWDAVTGQSGGEPLAVSRGRVTAVAIRRIGDRDVVISSGWARESVTWDAIAVQFGGESLTGHSDRFGYEDEVSDEDEATIIRIGVEDVIVHSDPDGLLRVQVATGVWPSIKAQFDETDSAEAVASGRIDGHDDVIVSGHLGGLLRVWDGITGQPCGEPVTGHTDAVDAVAIGRIGGRDVIVSSSADGTVRLWNIAQVLAPSESLVGHTGYISALAISRIGDRRVVVSSSWDKTVRVWDAATGRPVGKPLVGHTASVEAVAIGQLGERDVIVSGSWDHQIRVWDTITGKTSGRPLWDGEDPVQAVAIGRISERDVIVSGSWDHKIRVWDAVTGRTRGGPLTGHTAEVEAVAIGRIGDRDVIVSGSSDRTVRVWDAFTGQPHGGPLIGHAGIVTAVAIGRIGDHDIIVSASNDHTVRVWEAATGRSCGEPLMSHTDTVETVVIGRIGERDVIVSGSRDNTVQVWDYAGGKSLVIDLLGSGTAVVVDEDGHALYASAGHTICMFKL